MVKFWPIILQFAKKAQFCFKLFCFSLIYLFLNTKHLVTGRKKNSFVYWSRIIYILFKYTCIYKVSVAIFVDWLRCTIIIFLLGKRGRGNSTSTVKLYVNSLTPCYPVQIRHIHPVEVCKGNLFEAERMLGVNKKALGICFLLLVKHIYSFCKQLPITLYVIYSIPKLLLIKTHLQDFIMSLLHW